MSVVSWLLEKVRVVIQVIIKTDPNFHHVHDL